MRSGSEPLPPPSDAVAELIRTGVGLVLNAPPEWVAEMNRAVARPAGMERGIVDSVDSDTLAMTFQINEGNLNHWAQSNLTHPGVRVSVNMNEETASFIRDLVRRGFDSGALDSFRAGQNAAWQIWMQLCFQLTDDMNLLRELLEVTSRSIATFIDDTVGELHAGRLVAAGPHRGLRRSCRRPRSDRARVHRAPVPLRGGGTGARRLLGGREHT